MNPFNWKKEGITKATPFLKKFARKVKKRFKPDLDDIHDFEGTKAGAVEHTPGLLEKGFALGLDLFSPLTAAPALAKQSNEGEFVHDIITKQPEIPAIGGFRIGHDPTGETDIGRRTGTFLASLPGQVKDAYEDYQLAREYEKLEKNIATLKPSLIPVTQSTTRG